ncbi:hypothetical protein AAJCM20276_27080 [Acetobacter aceti]|uniref:Antitoxin HicB n=2 Tax=Acetobacter aceti TaxID=435 RepID=A0A6S6PSJ3_ACEAC|nr:hypothetical protein AAJCM20276_27080 [Acetobacter aceti]
MLFTLVNGSNQRSCGYPRVFTGRGMSKMTYKGYHARVEFEPNDGVFAGRLAGINDIITFEADNVKGLEEAFHEAVEDYLETCQSIGKDPQKP